MKPLALTFVLTGFATHLTALSFQGEGTRGQASTVNTVSANIAILDYEPGRAIDDYLSDWLKQIDSRVEYAPSGRIYHIPRSFTLRVASLPRALRSQVVREVRRALGGDRKVDGAVVDGDRAGMYVESE